MGRIRNALRLVDAVTSSSSVVDVAGSSGTLVDVPSGASAGDLPAEVAVAFGLSADLDTITRREAMRVPAVKRGRSVIAGTIGTLPLVAVRSQLEGTRPDGVEVTRSLLEQPDPNTTRQHVVTWTVDDLLFHGVSWWRVLGRDGSNAGGGFPVAAERIAKERVSVVMHDGRRRVTIDGELAEDRDVIRFDGPDEGVLALGASTLRTALALEARVRQFAENPVPAGALEPVEGITPPSNAPGSSTRAQAAPDDPTVNQLTEVDDLLDGWDLARRRHTTAYLGGVKYATHAMDARSLQLAEARNFQATEVARLLNLPARYLNAPSGESLTYSTTESERRDLVDLSLSLYLGAIASRLSLGDVTPRGQRVAFDLSAFLRGDLTAAGTAIDKGIADADEARAWIGLRPRPAGSSPAPTPGDSE